METTKLYIALVSGNDEDVLKQLQEPEDDLDITARNQAGQTYLHLAGQKVKSIEVLKALLEKVDPSVRDEEGNTAIDLILGVKDCPVEVKMTVHETLKQRLSGKSWTELVAELLKGFLEQWMIDLLTGEELSEDIKKFKEEFPKMMATVARLHAAIEGNSLEQFNDLQGDETLLRAGDRTGLTPLHKAVAMGHSELVKNIVGSYPENIKVLDHMGRSALHYAAGQKEDDIYKFLVEAGADEELLDLNQKSPKDIKEDPQLLPGQVTLERLQRKLNQVQREVQDSTQTAEAPVEEQKPPSPKPATPPPASTQQTRPVQNPNRPVQMYISPDERPNPPPTTVDGRYVAEHLGNALTAALSEIAEKRPADPIEFLAKWLYMYHANAKYNDKQRELLSQIREEEAAKRKEREIREKRKQELQQLQEEERKKQEAAEEEKRRKEQEELQRKAKEAALSQQPGLETVMEDREEEDAPKDKPHKDVYGQTELHKLAGQTGADLFTLLNMGYSPSERDCNNKTARDIAVESGVRENVEAIDQYVQKLVEMGEFDKLEDLMLAGYDKFDVVLAKLQELTTSLPEKTKAFLKELPEFLEKIQAVFRAVQTGGLADLKVALEVKKLALAQDQRGRSLLHLAILGGHRDVVEHLTSHFPMAMKCKDNLDRTPYHYAMAESEEMASILQKHGADVLAQDVKKQQPSFYKDLPEEILAMKSELTSGFTGTQHDAEKETSPTQGTNQQETQEEA